MMKNLITFAAIVAGFNFMSVDGNCMCFDVQRELFNDVKAFCRIYDEEIAEMELAEVDQTGINFEDSNNFSQSDYDEKKIQVMKSAEVDQTGINFEDEYEEQNK